MTVRTVLVALLIVVSLSVYSVWRTLEVPDSGPAPSIERTGSDWTIPQVGSDRYLVLLMIDGLTDNALQTALDDGRMPNLAALLANRPTAAMTAISTFPSATSPSVQELLSGRFAEMDYLSTPGAVHAFDREERHVVRYITMPDAWQWPVPTILDAVPGRQVVTVFEGRWDGPTTILTQYNMASQAILASLGASALSHGDAGPVRAYVELIDSGERPAVSLVVLNEFDVAAHFHGPDSPEAQAALRGCDERIGEIVRSLQKNQSPSGASLLPNTVFAIFGDHGMTRSGTFLDLSEMLREADISAVDVSTVPHVIFRERLGTVWTQWPDVILVAGGSNVTQAYLRKAAGGWVDGEKAGEIERWRWRDKVSLQALVELMGNEEGVDQLIWQDAAGAIVIRAGGLTARVLEDRSGHSARYAYLVGEEQPGDPLGYLEYDDSMALVCRGKQAEADCFYDAMTWMNRTLGSNYPGAVPLLPKSFRPPRFAGDLIVTSKPGYSFLRNQKGDHGNLYRDSVLTPLIFNGPGVRECIESSAARLVDIYPTASVLLGADAADEALRFLDGRVLDCAREPMP